MTEDVLSARHHRASPMERALSLSAPCRFPIECNLVVGVAAWRYPSHARARPRSGGWRTTRRPVRAGRHSVVPQGVRSLARELNAPPLAPGVLRATGVATRPVLVAHRAARGRTRGR